MPDRKEYLKQWHLRHKEHEKQYRIKNSDKLKERNKQWRNDNPVRVKEYNIYAHGKWNPILSPRRVTYKEKRVVLKENPRTGYCSLCRYHGRTNIHHIEYHDDDPLKDTIELCASCHRKTHLELNK